MRRHLLDEMQIQRRNMVGNQAFMLLFYLLMIDIGLYGFGFRWFQYPMNVFVIMLGCMTYYMIRIIWNNSYVGPGIETKSMGRKIALVMGLAGLVSGILIVFKVKDSFRISTFHGDNGGILLFIFSLVLVIVLAVVGLISRWQTSKDE